MEEVVKSRRQVDPRQTLADTGQVDWDAVFDGFEASCNCPSCSYWQELHHHYPAAKIVLTVRDENRWYDSCVETIYRASFAFLGWALRLIPPIDRINRMIIASVWDGVFYGRFEDREYALQVYRDHIAHVNSAVPSDRLLVFEAKDGWEPLCRFLDVPVPENPYPHLNDAARIKGMLLAARLGEKISAEKRCTS
jgi:hypothetical protein